MKKLLLAVLISGMVASQASAMLGSGQGSQDYVPFNDVDKDSPYYDAISYLKTEGVVSGYPDGSFKPYQTINRAEFTKIIVGSTGYDPAQDPSGYDIYSTSGMNFSDIENGAWYNPYLRKAVGLDLIGGYPDGTYKPAQNINFAEASKIIVVSYGGEFAGAGYAPEDWFHKYVNVLESHHAIPTTINAFDQQITRGEMSEMLYRLKKDVQTKPSETYDEIAQPRGYLTGALSYPAEGIPADMAICADKTTNAETYCTYTKIVDNSQYGQSYKLAVPAGTYKVYAVEGTLNAFYSKFVTCGGDVSCTDHTPIVVTVTVGHTTSGVDPQDWYAQ